MKSEIYLFIFFALLTMIISVLAYLRYHHRNEQYVVHRKRNIRKIILGAQEHNQIFELKLQAANDKDICLAGRMQRYDPDELKIEALSYIDPQMKGKSVDVYFRLNESDGPTFYKFESRILSVRHLTDHSRFLITITTPNDLKVGQKRAFIRVSPPSDTIRVIALWPLDVSTPVPKSTVELKPPAIHYKRGMHENPIKLENISATGIAVSISMKEDSQLNNFDVGTEMLALIIYELDKKSEQVVTFWCTSQVVNVRSSPPPDEHAVLGMQFKHWAVLEPGNKEINWFHTSPTKGAAPISQWVMRIDRHKHGLKDRGEVRKASTTTTLKTVPMFAKPAPVRPQRRSEISKAGTSKGSKTGSLFKKSTSS
jgi:hypothetical protein